MKTLERRILTMPLQPLKLLRKRKQKRHGYGRRDDEKPKKEEQPRKDEEAADQEEEESEGEEQGKEEGEDEEEEQEGRDEDSPGTIQGYAAVFHAEGDAGTEYELWSDPAFRAVERIAAGCFRQAIGRPDDVRGLYNHEPDQLLGRTLSGTMRVEEDERGLRYEIDLPDTQTGRDVAQLVDRGDLTGSSFGFVVEQESWRETEEPDGQRIAVRTIESVRLLDAGPVTYPAYAGTSAGRSATTQRALGSADEARASYQRWKEQQSQGGNVPLAARLAAVRAREVQVRQPAG